MTTTDDSNNYYLGQGDDALLRYRLFNELYQPGTAQRFAELDIADGVQVLELGCGIGETACYIAQHVVPHGHVTAFDPAEDLVAYGRRRAAQLGIENISFIHASAQTFEFERERWDVVHTRYVLSYLSDAQAIVQRIYSALRPSGLFFGEEIGQLYIKHGETDWYESMCDWFAALIEAGGGNANYGTAQLPGDLLKAGFSLLDASAYWPLENQTKVVEMLRLALSEEMKKNLVRLGIATEAEVDSVVNDMQDLQGRYMISPSMAAYVVAQKPQAD